jgi:hypothetical protein
MEEKREVEGSAGKKSSAVDPFGVAQSPKLPPAEHPTSYVSIGMCSSQKQKKPMK